MTPTPAQQGSSFGTVNGEFTASDAQLEKRDNNAHVDLNWNTELEDTTVSKLSKNCTRGISTGTPNNRGTSTVVCTVTTRHQSL